MNTTKHHPIILIPHADGMTVISGVVQNNGSVKPGANLRAAVFNDADKLKAAINDYIDDPEKIPWVDTTPVPVKPQTDIRDILAQANAAHQAPPEPEK